MDEHDEDIRAFRDSFPERFIVTETELDQATYQEYQSVVEKIGEKSGYDVRLAADLLYESTTPMARKKEVLVRLARGATTEAYRLLQEYLEAPDAGMAEWGKIALYECQMLLTDAMLDEGVGLISTGLGGKGNRLRYIVAIGIACPDLADDQRALIARTIREVCERHDSELEDLQITASHLKMTVLIPMDTAPADPLEEVIKRINADEELLYVGYMITNVRAPSDEEISVYLEGEAEPPFVGQG